MKKIDLKTTILALLLVLQYNSISQINEETPQFYFDAVFFKGEVDTAIRVDVFTVVPYQSLNFIKVKEKYSAKFNCTISIIDSSFNILQTKNYEKTLIEEDYIKANGGTGAFDYSQNIFNLKKGNYYVKATIEDKRNNRIYERTRSINLVDFNDFNFSLSSIMLLSRIEENNGKYKITPHISDDISDLKEGYFAFFEIYAKNKNQKVDFIYKIFNNEGKEISTSKKTSLEIKDFTTRHFIKILNPEGINEGKYILRILALKNSSDTTNLNDNIIASAERSIKYQRTFAGVVLKDIDKSIKELRYVASQKELELIEEGKTIDERQKRFEEFWKNLDPSPTTDRNEAFEEYFSRIDFANKNFKSYADGWRSDKGNAYVVYGPPFSIERSSPYNDGRVYEIWNYKNSKQIIFLDYNGFGDFKLYSPMTIMEKYKWER